jgi:hypothetical protein
MGWRGFGLVHHSRTIFSRAVPNLSITSRNFSIAVPPPPTAAAVSTAAEGAARAGSRMMLRASCSAPALSLALPWPRFPTPASTSTRVVHQLASARAPPFLAQ